MAMVEFPSSVAGREAYRRLREFRRLHEHAYSLDLITVKEGDNAGSLMPTKQRGKVLMNQKANTVADLAAVLLQFERGPEESRILNKEHSAAFWKMRRTSNPQKYKRIPLPPVELAGIQGVRIRWTDPFDAEFAREWPRAVVHHQLTQARHSPAFPEMLAKPAEPDFSEEGDDSVSLLPHGPEVESLPSEGAVETGSIQRKEMLFPKAPKSEIRVRPRPRPTKGFRGQPRKAKVKGGRSKVKLGSEAKRGRERIGAASWIERR